MPMFGKTDTLADAPKFIVDSVNNQTGQQEYNVETFFFDSTEIAAQVGCPHTGWVRKVSGTGTKTGKVYWEVIVAL